MTDIVEITDCLYLGSLFATHPDNIRQHKIKHIISLGAQPCAGQVSSLFFDVSDNVHSVPVFQTLVLPSSYQFIHECIDRGENVLVHCVAGKSRSATVVIYYLMKRFGMSFDEAYRHVQSVRPVIGLNHGFWEMLRSV
jgi:predicted protein tyrosine phosphatase